jgi:hypothetical protein
MTECIALFRGINVGRAKRIAMRDLRKLRLSLQRALGDTCGFSAQVTVITAIFSPTFLRTTSISFFVGRRPATLPPAAPLTTRVRRLLQDMVETTRLFVLPSPSGAARRFWNEQHWHELALLRNQGALDADCRRRVVSPPRTLRL